MPPDEIDAMPVALGWALRLIRHMEGDLEAAAAVVEAMVAERLQGRGRATGREGAPVRARTTVQ